MPKILNEASQRLVRELLTGSKGDLTNAFIADRAGCSPTYVSKIRSQLGLGATLGVPGSFSRLSQQELDTIRTMWLAEKPVSEIRLAVGCNQDTIYVVRDALGLPKRDAATISRIEANRDRSAHCSRCGIRLEIADPCPREECDLYDPVAAQPTPLGLATYGVHSNDR